MPNPLEKYYNATTTIPTQTDNPLEQYKSPVSPEIDSNNPLDKYKSVAASAPSFIGKIFESTFGEGMATGEFSKMTTFGQALDLMGRPGYAIKSVMNQSQQEVHQYLLDNGLSEEEINNPLSLERQRLLMKIKPDIKERFKALWRGFTGHERVAFRQVREQAGLPNIFGLDFVGEIATDPLMWAGGAGHKAITAGVKVATKPLVAAGKVGVELARKIPKVAQAIDFAVDRTGEAKNLVYNTFIAKSKIPELAAAVDKYLSKRQWLAGKGISFGVQTRDAIQKVMKETGRSADDVEKMIVNIIERPRTYTKLATTGERAIAKAVQGRLQQTFTTMTDTGVPISALGAARRERIVELKDKLVGAVGKKKEQLLAGIAEHQQALQDEIIRFKSELRPLEVDVAHYSKNPNITGWKVNKKTVKNDLGEDFGSESAALARQKDISKGGVISQETYYHGTTASAAKRIKKSGWDLSITGQEGWKGVWITDDMEYADMFATLPSEGRHPGAVMNIYFKKKPKLFHITSKKYPGWVEANLAEIATDAKSKLFIEAQKAGFTGDFAVQSYLESLGYHGIAAPEINEFIIFKPNEILSLKKPELGKVYYTKLSPRRSIDMTGIPMEEQLQYWDNPDDIINFLSKKEGILQPDEIEKLKLAIPDPQDIKFKQSPKIPVGGGIKNINPNIEFYNRGDEYYIHIADKKNLNDIKKEGLLKKADVKSKWGGTPTGKGVYAWDKDANFETFIMDDLNLNPEDTIAVVVRKSKTKNVVIDEDLISIPFEKELREEFVEEYPEAARALKRLFRKIGDEDTGAIEAAKQSIIDKYDIKPNISWGDFGQGGRGASVRIKDKVRPNDIEAIFEYNDLAQKWIPIDLSKKTTTKLIASPTGEEGLAQHLKTFLGRELSEDEVRSLLPVVHGGTVDIGDLRIKYNPATDKYNILKITTTAPTEEVGKFLADKFYDAQQDWYVDLRQKLINKGYDSIKYFSLEDTATPTYKILTGRVVGPATKASVRNQEKLATMITAKEAEVTNLVNEAKEIYHLPVSERRIVNVAKKLGVGKIEAKEIAQLQRAREMGYFPRITSKEAEGFLRNANKNPGMGVKVWNPKIKNALRRKTSDFTLDEWNAFVAENGIESLGGNKIQEYFMRDPAYATALYEVRAAKAITSAEFIQDAGKTFGKSAKESLPGWIEAPEAIQKLYPAIKGLKFDPEVLKEITRVTEYYINPQSAGPIVRTFDNIQNSWRKWTLAPFPKYHLRNMVGNLWNNYLADVDIENYPKAQALQLYRKYGGKGNLGEKVALAELERFGISPDAATTIITSAEESGVLGRGWYGADIEMGIRQQMGKGGLIQRGLAVGTTIENNARLAHFLDKLDKGADSMEAALSVKRYLFDYGDITQFERDVMRRLFPFYTWSRKNMPLQMQELYKNPQKFAPLAIPFRLRNEEDIIKLKYARPDLYERLPIELSRTMDTVTYVPLEGLIPAGDLAKMGRPHELLFELLTPYIRVPLELYMNKSMYFGTEIEQYPGETQQLWRMDIPVKLKYLLTTVLPQARLISEIDKIVKKQTNKEELTPAEQAFSQSLSSIYKINLKELEQRALSNLKKKAEELRKGAAIAGRQGRPTEIQNIKRTYYEKLRAEIKRIQGD